MSTAYCSSLTQKTCNLFFCSHEVGNEIDELINGSSRVIRCLVGLAFTSPEHSMYPIEKSFLGDCDRMYNRLEMRKSLLTLPGTAHAHISRLVCPSFRWMCFREQTFSMAIRMPITTKGRLPTWVRNSWLMETIDSMPIFALSQPKWFLFLFCFWWKYQKDLCATFYSVVCALGYAVSFPTVLF